MKLNSSFATGFISFIVTMAVANSSCEHKDLCYDHDHRVSVNLVYDWSEAPDANPKGMRIFFYPIDNDSPIEQFNFTNNIEGGEIKLLPGHYRMITYNNDSEVAKPYDIDDYFSHHFYTRTASLFEPVSGGNRSLTDENIPRPAGSEDQMVLACPDQLWGCSCIDIEIKNQDESQIQTLTVFPENLVCHYSYEVRNIKNLKSAINACAAISGMAPYVNLHDGSLGDRSIIHPIEAHRCDSTTIKGEFLTFGHNPVNDTPHRFGLYVWLADGSTRFFTDRDDFDVTNQIHSASDPQNVHIIIDGLNLPEIVGNGDNGAWNTTIDDWSVVDQEIIL